MDWLSSLILGEGIAHSIIVIAFVIAVGVALGKIKIFGVSLGVTWILFVGILTSHFNILIDQTVLNFLKDFGLIIFVYSLGMQVGPGFFASFKKGGVSLNLLAVSVVLLTVLTTLAIHAITGVPLSTMIGVMSGAVTNTPGLGAAQQTIFEVSGVGDPTIAIGYAVAYPMGVVGVILTIVLIRYLFKVNIEKETQELELKNESKDSAQKIAVELSNDGLAGKSIYEIDSLTEKKFVVSRICHANGYLEVPTSTTIVNKGDRLLIVTSKANESALVAFFGKKIEMSQAEWGKLDPQISRRLLLTKSEINGKRLGDLKLRAQYGINITRVNRAGVDLVASPGLHLHLGDRLMVVGNEKAVDKVANILGNSLRKLREPNLIPIFLGILLGVLLGSVPFMIPGIPQPVKLGLAGGPLVIAILIARFGPKYKLVTYSTMSANMMLRELGISLFLAAVGLGAGQGFWSAIVNGGYMWVIYGSIITIVPILTISVIGRYVFKLDYFSLIGIVAGSQTNPIALSYANTTFNVSQIAVVYATVYPLTMFLRVLAAQIMALI